MVVENDPPYIGGRHLVFVQIELLTRGSLVLGERVTGSGYSGQCGRFGVDHFADRRSLVGMC